MWQMALCDIWDILCGHSRHRFPAQHVLSNSHPLICNILCRLSTFLSCAVVDFTPCHLGHPMWRLSTLFSCAVVKLTHCRHAGGELEQHNAAMIGTKSGRPHWHSTPMCCLAHFGVSRIPTNVLERPSTYFWPTFC